MLLLRLVTLLYWLTPENKVDTDRTAADNPANGRKADSGFAFEKRTLTFFYF